MTSSLISIVVPEWIIVFLAITSIISTGLSITEFALKRKRAAIERLLVALREEDGRG